MIENNKGKQNKTIRQNTISTKNKIPQQHKHLPSLIQKELATDILFSLSTPKKNKQYSHINLLH